jgi:murein DD-endopeptidase MepM/ murein hydrolase activator NlpD
MELLARTMTIPGEERQPSAFIRFWRTCFAERQLFLRTGGAVRFVTLPSWLQASAAFIVLGFALWLGFSSISFFRYDSLLDRKDIEVGEANAAYAELLAELKATQERFEALTGTVERNHGYLLSVIKDRPGLFGDGGLSDGPDLPLLEKAIPRPAPKPEEPQSFNESVEHLEQRLAAVQAAQREFLAQLNLGIKRDIEDARRAIEITGLRADELIDQDDVRVVEGAMGGPFIAPGETLEPGSDHGLDDPAMLRGAESLESSVSELVALRRVLLLLPLRMPIEDAHVTSPFGRRTDPMNKRAAMHYGVDLIGAWRANVETAAPGTVVFAGRYGRYGRFVEIDHGMGVHTRYGHLHSISVKAGQVVTSGDVIGKLGSTGRSTGPHLHYEVVVDDQPVDPLRFIKAGEHVL